MGSDPIQAVEELSHEERATAAARAVEQVALTLADQ
jgi:hypothetical protein